MPRDPGAFACCETLSLIRHISTTELSDREIYRNCQMLKNRPKHSMSDAISERLALACASGLHFALHFWRRQAAMNELVGRIRAEFLEMPGLRLTVRQASRLWGLDEGLCRRVIDTLIGASFLRWTPSGAVARAED
jgi:hypothetical protein